MRNNVPCTYILVKKESIPLLLAEWKERGLKLSHIRSRFKEIRILANKLHDSRDYKGRTRPIPYPVLDYLEATQSKSEIAILLYLVQRYIWSKDNPRARFKLSDISSLTGISLKKLSRGLCSLRSKGIIITHKLHVTWTIAHGSQHSMSLEWLTLSKKKVVYPPQKGGLGGSKRWCLNELVD